MKKSFVVLDAVKYLFIVLLFLLGITNFTQWNGTMTFISMLLAILIILVDLFTIRKRENHRKFQSAVKETRESNMEAAGTAEIGMMHQPMPEIRDTSIQDFLEKISSIRNELNLKNEELAALQEASQMMTSTFDVKTIIEYIYSTFNRFTGCDRYLISLVDKERDVLMIKYEYGNCTLNEVGNMVRRNSIVAECYQSRKSLKKINTYIQSRNVFGDKLAIPLNASGELVGVLFIESGKPEMFSNINMNFLESLSVYAAIAMKNAELFNSIYEQKQEIEALYEETAAVNDELNSYINELNKTKEELKVKNMELTSYSDELQTAYFQTVMVLANSIEAKDSYTRGHCQRVMEVSCEIAKAMGLSEDQIEDVRYAAILHDIGKIGIPAAIINKQGDLTQEEMDEIKKHPLIAYNILRDVEFIRDGLDGILQHHERYDGTGYPYGLKGEEISIYGRILCIADAFDAMTSDRPYRKGMAMEEAVNEIEKCMGAQFDIEVTSKFIALSRQMI